MGIMKIMQELFAKNHPIKDGRWMGDGSRATSWYSITNTVFDRRRRLINVMYYNKMDVIHNAETTFDGKPIGHMPN
jgi:hypothetical protein